MVRHRKRKKVNHGQTPANLMKRAVEMVQSGRTLRETAKDLNISKSTLQRYVTKANACGLQNIRLTPNYNSTQIFTDEQEEELAEYLLTAAKHHHGLTVKATKDLAFQYGEKNNICLPESWSSNKYAGDDWFYGFMKRHPLLSIRKPEATSLSRATSFNKSNVTKFFQNLQDVIERYMFEPSCIYNCDETGLMTVHKPPNVIASKNSKQVGQVTSAERGVLVTVMCAVNAQGNSIPPFMIFPRVHFKEYMLKNAPPGTVGVAHHSGWMTADSFDIWMDHFVKYSHSSVEQPVLLLLDNHDSHISISVIDKAKSNGVIMLTFPPHCSHKLQPLDRSLYGPLKKFYGAACNSWLLNNPGKPMTIYEVAEMLGEAYPRAFSPQNVLAGFRCTGICPFNSSVFGEDEFLSSFVTDRPEITNVVNEQPVVPGTSQSPNKELQVPSGMDIIVTSLSLDEQISDPQNQSSSQTTEPRPPSYTDVHRGRDHPVPRALTYLDTLSEVRILQKLDEYEALFLKTVFERRNTYYIADEEEKVFFFAKEITDSLSRLCCNSRALEIHIVDDYGVTLLIVRRPLRCSSSCWWCFCLQDVEIEFPRGIVCAYVKEKWTPWWSAMDIVHPEGEVLYKIRGQCCSCKLRCHNSLQVFDAKTKQKVASYHKYCKGCSDWVAGMNDFSIQYHSLLTAEDKLLLMGAGFMVDLAFFEHRSF